MGSLSTVKARELDQPRKNLLEAVEANRFALKELSEDIGKNRSYLQQYLAKGSPRVLPPEVRAELALRLGVSEAAISHNAPDEIPSASQGAARPARLKPRLRLAASGASASPGQGHSIDLEIPRHRETDSNIDGQSAEEYFPCKLLAEIPPRAVAIDLVKAHGFLLPRNVLICDPEMPTKIGDQAVIIAGSTVEGVGILLPPPKADTLTWLEAGETRMVPTADATAWRILQILTAC